MATIQWPETLKSHTGKPYRLYEASEDYAFYYVASAFGFAHAKEILVRRAVTDPKIVLVEERTLSGNAWGVTEDGRPRTVEDPSTLTWFHVTSDWFRSLDHWRACYEKKERPLTLKEVQRIVRRAEKARLGQPRGKK
jgi:hypothetical protein